MDPQKSRNNTSPIEDNLVTPPGSRGRRIDTLLAERSEESLSRLRELLPELDGGSLAYVGARVADFSEPVAVPLMLAGLKMRSYAFVDAFLFGLAAKDRFQMSRHRPPLLLGNEFSEVRKRIAEFALDPELGVSDAQFRRRAAEINFSTTLALPVLRRCAGREVEEVAVKALTTGGIDPFMNRKACDLLRLREERSPSPMLSESSVISIGGLLESDLVDEVVLAQIGTIVGSWLEKFDGAHSRGGLILRNMFLETVSSFNGRKGLDFSIDMPRLIRTLGLLRHFDDEGAKNVLTRAVKLNDPSLTPVALLARDGASAEALSTIAECLSPGNPADTRLRALMVFSQSLSQTTDQLTFFLLNKYLKDNQRDFGKTQEIPGYLYQEGALVSAWAARRLQSEPLEWPFLRGLLSSLGDGPTSGGAASVLATSAIFETAKTGRIPPLWIYDSTDTIKAVVRASEYLKERYGEHQLEDGERPHEVIERVLLYGGPRAYGFELEISKDVGGAAAA